MALHGHTPKQRATIRVKNKTSLAVPKPRRGRSAAARAKAPGQRKKSRTTFGSVGTKGKTLKRIGTDFGGFSESPVSGVQSHLRRPATAPGKSGGKRKATKKSSFGRSVSSTAKLNRTVSSLRKGKFGKGVSSAARKRRKS